MNAASRRDRRVADIRIGIDEARALDPDFVDRVLAIDADDDLE